MFAIAEQLSELLTRAIQIEQAMGNAIDAPSGLYAAVRELTCGTRLMS